MPIDVQWHNQAANQLLITYRDPIIFDEIVASQDDIYERMNASPQPLDSIVDLREIKHIPKGILSDFPRLMAHKVYSHPRQGSIVCISNPTLLATFAQIYARVMPGVKVVFTLEEASALLLEHSG